MTEEDSVLATMQPVYLEEIGEAKLLSRVDTKFVAPSAVVAKLLAQASSAYNVLEIGGMRRMHYRSCYYDTPCADMYYEHQRGKKIRQKIRVRYYEQGEGGAYLEIKDKSNKGKTHKSRMELVEGTSRTECEGFISENSNYCLGELVRKLESHFMRITLVGKSGAERVTIDTGLHFHNLSTHRSAALPGVAVIEWKHSALSQDSPMKRIIRSLRIKESGFSKYCVGMANTDPSLKTNRIKSRLRMAEKLSGLD